MNYPSEPLTVIGQRLRLQFDCNGAERRSPLDLRRSRSRVKLILLGDPDAVDQNVIELERRGYCDSDAWTPPLIVRENASPIQPLPGELMRLYQRWYPATGLRLPL